jgi:hypothetical protein
MNRTISSLVVAGILIVTASFSGTATVHIAQASTCTGTYTYETSDLSDFWCPVTDLNVAYSAVPNCPTADPTGASCTGPCKVNTHWGGLENSCVIHTDYYKCLDASGVAITASCTAPVTAALVANPTSVLSSEQSLLTWSSVGATSCTGEGFSTGGAVSGSAIVRPTMTTSYAVTCTGTGGSASANAAVTVIDGTFQLSCQGHPLQAGIGEDVLWSSTVTGPQGTYVYAWKGAESLTGSGTQVFKKYSTEGAKTAQLTVEYIPTPGPMALFDSVKEMLASVAAAQGGIWVKSGPTTDYPCTYDWATSMYAGDSFNANICGPSATCTALEEGTTCFTIENAPPNCSYGGAGPMSLPQYQQHITPYTCTAVAPQPPTGTQCPVGQTPVATFNVMGASCSGGTVVGRTSEMLDAVQIGMWPDGWLVEQCSGLGAQEGDCCEYSQKASNSRGGGFPPNSYYQIRVLRGGSFSQTESDYVKPTGLCSPINQDHSCSSVAGTIGTKCVAGGSTDKTGKIIKTVQCDNAVTIGAPECSDGRDNNGDGVSDAQDPGCNGGSGTNGVYDPNDNSEGDGANSTGPQCSDGIDNNKDGTVDYPEDPGCSSADDNLELIEPSDLTLTANPPLVKKNTSCNISLSALRVTSCTLTGPGVSRTFAAVNGVVSTSQVVTPTLALTSTYVLSCTGLNGKTASKKVDCKVAPTFEEF